MKGWLTFPLLLLRKNNRKRKGLKVGTSKISSRNNYRSGRRIGAKLGDASTQFSFYVKQVSIFYIYNTKLLLGWQLNEKFMSSQIFQIVHHLWTCKYPSCIHTMLQTFTVICKKTYLKATKVLKSLITAWKEQNRVKLLKYYWPFQFT